MELVLLRVHEALVTVAAVVLPPPGVHRPDVLDPLLGGGELDVAVPTPHLGWWHGGDGAGGGDLVTQLDKLRDATE